MNLLWPGFLLLLGLLPLILAFYAWMLRRRSRFAVRYSSLALMREALPGPSRLRRHLPFALFLLALASMVMALTRPVSVVNVPYGQTTVILAMDVSRSMCSVDIPPNRLEAAKEAALSFIKGQPSGLQIGVVAFAGFAEVIQLPTTDQEMLEDAVDRLTTGRRTAIGSAILKSLDAIAEINESIAPSNSQAGTPGAPAAPLPEGTYAPDIIVLLTDGASNTGAWPMDAAQQAADRGIRVYTIGFGTDDGAGMDCGDNFWGDGMGSGGAPQFGGRFRRGIDEATLQEISALTGGEYYSATSADELHKVFRDLPSYLVTREEVTEVSVAFAAAGAFLVAAALLLSLLWQPYLFGARPGR